MITNFKDSATASVANGDRSRKLPLEIHPKAFKLLRGLTAATSIEEIRAVPGNRFHPLKDDREGQYSISINMKWRICFGWSDGGATDVEITDYH